VGSCLTSDLAWLQNPEDARTMRPDPVLNVRQTRYTGTTCLAKKGKNTLAAVAASGLWIYPIKSCRSIPVHTGRELEGLDNFPNMRYYFIYEKH
jgi:hypothetical protein